MWIFAGSTPSPADYNVQVKTTATGAIISQSERFAVPQSPAVSDTASQSSTGTPSSKKNGSAKRKTHISVSKAKPKDLFGSRDDLESLQEKIVEIANKDVFINDLVEQLEEIKQQMSDLKKEFETEKVKMKEIHEIELKDLSTQHCEEVSNIRSRIKEIESELVKVKEGYGNLKSANTTDLELFGKELESFKSLHENLSSIYAKDIQDRNSVIKCKENQLNELKCTYENLKVQHAKEIDEMKQKHQHDLEEIEFEMLKTVSETQKQIDTQKLEYENQIKALEKTKAEELAHLQLEFEKEKNELKTAAETQIAHLKEDFKEANILREMQMNEKCNEIEATWKLTLERQTKNSEQILKECQAISEYNIIQCEVEKNGIKADLEKTMKQLETLEEQKNLLEQQVAAVKIELSLKIEEIQTMQKTLTEQEEKNKKEGRAYEITITQLHATIDALKKRLIDSDRDVIQLKEELEHCEKSKLELESKCDQLRDEIKTLQTLNEEFEVQNEAVEKVVEERVKAMEKMLLDKVEDFKVAAQHKQDELNQKLVEKENLLQDTMRQLQEQQSLISESQRLCKRSKSEIEQLESANNKYEFECKSLKTNLELRNKEIEALKAQEHVVDDLKAQLSESQEKANGYQQNFEYYKTKTAEYESEMEDLRLIRKKYIDQSGKYDELLQRFENLETENSNLRTKITEQESLIGPFREQLEAYESEHRALMNEKRDAEAEAREMGIKYASILGHQNHKQKIKYLVDLQAKKFELIEEKKALESKIRNQARTIEKMKKEIAGMSKPKKVKNAIEDKENVNSPNRSVQCDSPGVLKERN